MKVLLTFCMSGVLSIVTHFNLLQVESSLGGRTSKTRHAGCDVSSGAQGELHAMRSWLYKNRSILHGADDPFKAGEVGYRELRYMIRENKLMKLRGDFEGDKHQREDMKSVEFLLWSTIRRFKNGIGDSDFVVVMGDIVHHPPPICQKLLCFTFSSARTGTPSLIGFPNPYYICYAFDVMHHHDVTKSKELVPWNHKKDKAFFIGSITKGESQTVKEVREQPRVRLASIAARNPKEFAVLWTGIDWGDWEGHGRHKKYKRTQSNASKVIRNAFKKEKHHDKLDLFEANPKYKYLIDLDGVSVSWRGYQLLGAESVMLLQDSNRGEFFFHDLKPWVHYVPFKHDLSDLVEKIQYLKENDEVALKIAREARLFWMRNLNFRATECWTREALKLAHEVASPQSSTDGFKVVPHTSIKDLTSKSLG